MPGAEKESLEEMNKLPETGIDVQSPAAQSEEETSEISPEEDAAQVQDTLREMIVGIIVLAVLFGAVFLIFGRAQRFTLTAGLVIGAVTAEIILRHMYITIGRAVDMDADSATRYTKKSSMFRLLVAGIALSVALLVPKVFHIVGTLAGLFCLKFAAYIQPLTHKILKFTNKGR